MERAGRKLIYTGASFSSNRANVSTTPRPLPLAGPLEQRTTASNFRPCLFCFVFFAPTGHVVQDWLTGRVMAWLPENAESLAQVGLPRHGAGGRPVGKSQRIRSLPLPTLPVAPGARGAVPRKGKRGRRQAATLRTGSRLAPTGLSLRRTRQNGQRSLAVLSHGGGRKGGKGASAAVDSDETVCAAGASDETELVPPRKAFAQVRALSSRKDLGGARPPAADDRPGHFDPLALRRPPEIGRAPNVSQRRAGEREG